ncbi:MAG: hypothetical protein RBU45_19655 [Myxococcota bacterium]|jgi:hypothetical protein|nr:hypothetical protein [Myxococcota bacterium]
MGASTRGRLIRSIDIGSLGGLLPIPSALKYLFQDGYDACLVVEVGRNKMRVNLAISSGGELVVPAWLQEAVSTQGKAAGVDEVSFYLSTRPIWLVEGDQDEALKKIWELQDKLSPWERLSDDQRKQIAVRWLIEGLLGSDPDFVKTALASQGWRLVKA